MTATLLRVFATLFVFLLHGRSYLPGIDLLPEPLYTMSYLPAWAGVWIFVLLSGYGIECGLCSRGGCRCSLVGDDGKLSLGEFLNFYVRRFLKLAPVCYLYCIFFELLSGQMYLFQNPDVALRMLTFTYNGNPGIGGLGHLWYVSLAMRLYLVMPFIHLLLEALKDKQKVLISVLIASVILGAVVRMRMLCAGADWYNKIYTNCFTNLDLVLCGMIVARAKYDYNVQLKHTSMLKAVAAALFGGLVIYNCSIYAKNTPGLIRIYRGVLPSAYACCCSLLLLLSDGEKHDISKRRNILAGLINKFSGISYTFYIVHISVFRYLRSTLVAQQWYLALSAVAQYFLFMVIAFGITVAVATPLSWLVAVIPAKLKKSEMVRATR